MTKMDNSSGVSRVPVANRREVKKVAVDRRPSRFGVNSELARSNAAPAPLNNHEPAPSKSGVNSKLSCANAVPAPLKNHTPALLMKHLSWYVALNRKPSEEKMSHIPQIKWKCPPEFAPDARWCVAGGGESQEAKTQKRREASLQEVVYPHLLAIPSSPVNSVHVEAECSNNSCTEAIPIIPIEEVAEEETPVDTLNTHINPRLLASDSVSSVSGNLPSSQCDVSGPKDQPFHDKSLPNMSNGPERIDQEVAAAAAASVGAVMEKREHIDTDLLVKFLTDPETVKKLMYGNAVAALLESETAPQPEQKSTFPNSTHPSTDQQGEVEREMNKSATEQDGIRAESRPTCATEPLKISSPSPRPESHVPLVQNSTSEPGCPAQSHIHQQAGMQQGRPIMPCTSRPDEETINTGVNKYLKHDVAGTLSAAPLIPSTSNPKVEAIKKLIHEYGASRINPVAPLIASTSRSPNMEERKKTRNEYGVAHGWGTPYTGPPPVHHLANLHALPNAPVSNFIPMHPLANLHALPNASVSNFIPPGNFGFPLPPPAPIVDLNYHESLMKKHGEKHETREQKLPITGQYGNNMQGESAHNSPTSVVTKPKSRKLCSYFGTLKGCRNGFKCPFQHDVSKLRANEAVKVPVAKRMKFT